MIPRLAQVALRRLAGRAAIVQLLPLSHRELAGAGKQATSVDALLWKGLYPALYDPGAGHPASAIVRQ